MIKFASLLLELKDKLPAVFLCAFLCPAQIILAQTTITNTAAATGDNIEPVTSNETSLVAGQAALQLVKTGDRAAAEPGDTVVYRLVITNTGTVAATNLTITDKLPRGLNFLSESLQGAIASDSGRTSVNLTADTGSSRTVTITTSRRIPPNETLTVVYAAVVTPEAIRGTGKNLATANAGNLQSNSATHLLRIRPGILSDCATLIGRVFVDKNFDGEQQPGEAGVPNAVIYMDDGNRIVTDPNGLFSLANVISGNRTATLDLSSLPGYALAPNNYFIERNSQSRLVRLAPGALARVNFAVTPAFGEGQR